MCKLLENSLGGLFNRTRIIKWGAVVWLALAATALRAQPTNDNFANATVISNLVGTISGSNVGATAEAGEPDHAGNPGGPFASIWYQWTSPFTGTINFNTEGSISSLGGGMDTVMGVYTGNSVSSLTVVASNDDVNPFAGDFTSSVTFPVTNGTVYYIAVDGFAGETGSVDLNWSQSGALSSGQFQFTSSTTIDGQPGFVFTDHETSPTVEEVHMTPNGARARITRTGGSAGLVHVSYRITNLTYVNLLMTNIFGTNLFATNYITNMVNGSNVVTTNWTNIFITNIAAFNFFGDYRAGDTFCTVIGTNSTFSGTTITITNDNTGFHSLTVTNYPIPLTEPNPCLNTNYPAATVTNTSGSTSNFVNLYSNLFCTNFTVTNIVPSATPNVDYSPTFGTVDFRDYQMGVDIPVFIFPSPGGTNQYFNHLIQIVITGVALDPLEPTNLISPPIMSQTNAIVESLNQNSFVLPTMGVPPCETTNLVFNLDKAVWTCTESVGGLNTATVFVVRGGYDGAASGSVQYDIDWAPNGADRNDVFALQPGSDYATPDNPPAFPTSSQTPDFTSVTGSVTIPANFPYAAISIPIVDDTIVEFNEDMHIRLHDPSGGVLGQNATATLTILFDDQPAGAIDRDYNPDNNASTAPVLFNGNPGANKATFACVLQPDGRAIIAGDFTAYNTLPENSIARINTNGLLDQTFLAPPNSGANGTISALAIDTNNLIYIGGSFTSFNGTARNGVARLNPDGSLDTSFNPGVGLNSGGSVKTLALQPDGHLVIGGNFSSVNATNRFNVARLNNDGTLDLSFDAGVGPNATVSTLVLQTNGSNLSVVIGGGFTLVNGARRAGVARLNPDGSLDTTFNPGIGIDANTAVNALAIQSDNKVLVGGSFNTFNLYNSKSLVRLGTNGTVDTSFNVGQGASDTVNSIVVDPDGTILIGGQFTSYNQTRRIGIARLFNTGSLDTSFMDTAYNQFAGVVNTFYSTDVQPKNSVDCMAVQGDGNIVIGGSFGQLGGAYVTNAAGSKIPARDGFTARQNFARLIGGTTGGPGNIGLAYTNYTANENGGDAFVTLNRSNGHLGPAGVAVSVTDPPAGPGAAVSGQDYTFDTNFANPLFPSSYPPPAQSTWMWADGLSGPNNVPVDDVGNSFPGFAAPQVFVSIINNNVVDGNRSLNLALSNPTSADVFFLGGENIPVGTALDTITAAPMEIIDDDAPHGVISFTSAAYTVDQNAGSVLIPIVRTAGGAGQISFTVQTVPGGTAVAGTTNDYISISNVITLGDSITNASIKIPVVNNGIAKPDVTVFLLITNITGGASAGLTNSVLTIINDNFSAGHLQFTSTNFGANENAGTALITVSRTGGSTGSISVTCASSNGSATNGLNFSASTNVLNWNAGDVSNKTFTVPLLHDGLVTSNLSVNLRLFNPIVNGGPNGAALGSQSNAVLTITNVDFYGQPTLSAANYNVNENAGFVTVTVNRLGGTAQTMTVNYATSDGSAIGNLNYTPVSGTLTFPPGVFSTNFIVPITPGNPPAQGPNTTFTVALSNPTPASGPGAVTLGTPSSATVTIINVETFNQPAGTVDQTYNGSFDNNVYSLTLQTNGQLLAGGDFALADGITRNRIARLNIDGTLDDKFATDVDGADNSVRAVVSQSDGRILIGGLFANVNDVARAAIARLNYDGTLDTIFNPGSGADGQIYAIGEMFVGPVTNTNRRILVGGSFSKINSITSPCIGRFNDDGTVDLGFSAAGANGTVYAIAVYSTNDVNSGKVLVGGDFTQVGGVARQHIARLNADGTLDATFNPGAGASDSVRAIAIQQDGNIVIGGLFTMVGNTALNHIARLTPNGLVDPTFSPGPGVNDVVNSLALQEDHKIVVAGFFTQANGVARNRLTRMNPDGSLDLAINFGTGANDFISSVVIQSDERLVVGGGFTQFDGFSEPHIARLYGLTTPGPGTLTFSSASYQVNETSTNAVITIQRDGGTGDTNIGSVSVIFSTSDGTGVSGTDYLGVTNTLVFPVGSVFATISIPIISNSIVQSDRTVNLTLSNPTDAALGIQPTAVLTIVNNNSDVSFSATAYRVSKGDSTGEAIITVVRNGSSVGPISVDLATGTNGSAIPGFDYLPATNTVLFADGQVQGTVAIHILTNSMPGNRTVGLVLQNATNTIATDPETATLTIVDDSTSPGFVMFASTNYFVSELAGSAIINLVRTNGVHNPVSVVVSTGGGTAVPGVNYAPTNVSVGFADGQSNASFTVSVFHDPQVTGDLTVNLTLSSASNGVQLVPPLTVPLTIQDADTGFAFDQPAYFVDETNHTVTIGVDRIGSTNGNFTVQYATTNGTALTGTNYIATNGVLTFAPGETFQTFTIPILDNPQITGDKIFFVQLSNPSAPGQLVNPATTAVTVLDDDVGLALTTATNTVSEAGTNILVSVVRTGNTVGIVSVQFGTLDGTATNGVRYIGTNGTLTFAAGQTSNSFVINVINDNIVEGDQTFSVVLSNPTGGAQLLAPTTEVITVTDDDSAFNFSSAAYSIGENGVTAIITAIRTGVTNTTVSVNFATSNLTAQAGVQYHATNGTLVFTNGQTTATFGVGIIDANVTGGSETVALSLSNPTPASNSSLTSPSQAVLTIFNDDGSLIVPAGTYLISETGPGATNNLINPGDTVTMLLALRNSAGTNTTPNFQATLLATNGVSAPSPSTPVTYGVLVTNGPSVSRQFTFTLNGTNGTQVGATLHMQDGVKDLGFATFNFILGQTTTYFTNTNYITINDDTAATPYPSAINVSSLPGQISKITATVSNLGHAYLSDVCMLMVGPGGQKDLLMAQAGGSHTVTNITLTFDDSLTNYLTTNSPVSGSYPPTAFTTGIPFPGPAPTGPYNTNFSNLIGGSPDGTWALYVFDDKVVDIGSINNGWSLAISTLNVLTPSVDLIVGMTGSANPAIVGSNLTYTITVTNSGPAPASGVVLTNFLPPGVTLVASTPPGDWSSGSVSNTVVCNVGALPVNSNFTATLVVNVPVVANITNTVTASANEAEANAADNTATVVTTINNTSADMAVGLTASANPILIGNSLIYSISVTNLGPGTATGVVVTNTLPAGVALMSLNPSGIAVTNGGIITVSYALGSIGNGGTANLAITVQPKVPGLANDVVNVSSGVFDPLKGNNTATAKTQVEFVQLNVVSSAGSLTFSWPVGANGYVLQTTPGLAPPNWTTVPNGVTVVNGQNTVTVPLTGGPGFFRLSAPAP